jgi:hypothetical protein
VVGNARVGLLEFGEVGVLGQVAEGGHEAGPAPLAGDYFLYLQHQEVPGLQALHIDGAGHGVNLPELVTEEGQVLRSG